MKILIRPRRQTETTHNPVVLRPATVTITSRPQRVLDFDVETRPLHWYGGDFVSKEVTAIAWTWIGEPEPPTVHLLTHGTDPRDILRAFLVAYDRADLVCGHYIRGFDLPTIMAGLIEFRLPLLSKKWTHDTKLDLVKFTGLSKSQENLGSTLGLSHPKVPMNQASWRSANRLEPEGIDATRARVAGDVLQNVEMRQKLLALGYLSAPKLWEPRGADPLDPYVP